MTHQGRRHHFGRVRERLRPDARSIGDRDAKFLFVDEDDEDEDEDGSRRSELVHSAAVIPTPEISLHTLGKEDVALVIACDGLFENEENDPAAAWMSKIVREGVVAGRDGKTIAKELVEKAIDDGSEDNCTAIVVIL